MGCEDACTRPTPAQAHCGACHVTFGGIRGFDVHRRGGQCAAPDQVGLAQDARGVWRHALTSEERARFVS